jgi:phosphoglucomutase
MAVHPLAGKPAPQELLTNIPRLISAYYSQKPDPHIPEHRISFGTSGHRGTSFDHSFNEDHILAISQALCEYRKKKKINGPLFIGMDTHALSEPAFTTALEVFAANEVEVMVQEGLGYTPTPVISHMILTYNQGRKSGLADGVVITPSHNPPPDGGFKYNPPTGGSADTETTLHIQKRANEILENGNREVKRMGFERALKSSTTNQIDFMESYIYDLQNVIDMKVISGEKIKIGVDPMGGAGIAYWEPIADVYGLDLTLVKQKVDPTFSFMHVDWDGKIRMDCSSPYAMKGLIKLKNKFDIAFGNDPDYDRHGIVTRSAGLMNPNHYLSVAIFYLFKNRKAWQKKAQIGKTLVSSSMIDRVAKFLKREVCEVPVGFKWFVQGLLTGSFGFAGEESAGASFLKKDGTVWTTDKDGILLGLLAAEITAGTGKDPGEQYRLLEDKFGSPVYERIDTTATPEQKKALKSLTADKVKAKQLAGEKIETILTHAPGNQAAIGGIKIVTKNGWFAARPSGTENINKIYSESFKGKKHLKQIQQEAQQLVTETINQVL